MNKSVFLEMEFFLLIIFSFIVPVGIYIFLFRRASISRFAVLVFALLLVVVSGVDVILLRHLAGIAKTNSSILDEKIFSGELSLALYLLPVVFAGLGVNMGSHVLISHLTEAEKRYDKAHKGEHPRTMPHSNWLNTLGFQVGAPSALPKDWLVFVAGMVGMATIFVLDVDTGDEIRLHTLYIFPLALIALQCDRRWLTLMALLSSISAQIITFSLQNISVASYITDFVVAVTTSLLTVTLAQNARKNHLKAIQLATVDELTQLANRRSFVAIVDAEIARQRRYGGTMSLVVVDLDGFKKLNDSKGHGAGDAALKLAAKVFRESTRKSDSVARIGGDEFAILMPNTQDVECDNLCKQLCEGIANQMRSAGFSVTASIGFTTFDEAPESTSMAVEDADRAMYWVKTSGKNGVAKAS
jgi:diguanylate cyclase (GGDEF)-like protein